MPRLTWFAALALGVAAVGGSSPAEAQNTSIKAYGPCRDAWITSAFRDVTGGMAEEPVSRSPAGYGDTGECNPKLYGGGSWSGYADLQSKVKNSIRGMRAGVCRDASVTQAVKEVKAGMGIRNSGLSDPFAPQGAGERGECSMHIYGGGSWSSYADLKSKVTAVFTNWRNASVGFDVNGNFMRSGTTLFSKPRVVIIPTGLVNQAIAAGIVSGGAGNIVSNDGATIVSGGAGN